MGQVGLTKKYKVRSIILEGNQNFPDREITRKLNLSKSNFFFSQRLSRNMIKTDNLIIKTFYLKHGFLNCVVQDSIFIDDDQNVDIYFKIKEGERYYLEAIEIQGNQRFSKEYLVSTMDLEMNTPYDPITVRKSLKEVKQKYENRGKPFINISDSLVIEKNQITLFLAIEEGSSMTIRNIEIKNNKKVETDVIQRELVIYPGDLYSKSKIEKSKRYLIKLGLFTTVNINYSNIDTVNNEIDLVVYVREQDMRYWEFNTGVAQKEGLGTEVNTTMTMSAQWRHKNIQQKAKGLSVRSEIGLNPYQIESRPDLNANITYTEPWLIGLRSTTLIRFFIDDLEQEQYDYNKFGVETSLIINPDKRNYLKAGVEVSGIANRFEEIDSSLFKEIEREKERAIIFDYTRDRRNDFLFPSRGHLMTFSGKIASSILGGTEDYFQFETSYSEYFLIFNKFIFAYRGKIGFLTPYGKDRTAPEYEKYYLGGATSMRGWENLMFLTKTSDAGERIADRKKLKVLTTFELRFPIYWRIGGEVFFDGGNLVSDFMSLKNSQYKWNFGVGLTVATPLGPARVDFARPLLKGEKTWIPQFAISYAF